MGWCSFDQMPVFRRTRQCFPVESESSLCIEEVAMSKRQILVVDDDHAVREIIATLLISEGYDVVAAEDGFAALAQLKKKLPDVIVSDLEMPGMSGFELLSVVRRHFPQILTLAMSGAFLDDGVPMGVIADGFCAKGGSLKNLFRALEQLIGSAPARADARRREIAPVLDSAQWE
jgi:CheY-like chemotaxis protein